MLEIIRSSFEDARQVLDEFISNEKSMQSISDFAELLVETFDKGDAMHFAEEWTGRYRKDRKPMPALAFSDVSHISCTSNDYGFEHIFERMVDAFGEEGDIFLAITTSGNSKNLLLAAEAAKRKGMKVVGLVGKDGGKIKDLCDIAIIAPGKTSDRIQEIHIKVIHIVIECVERRLFPELYQ